ncbi:MAG: glycosyltransferase [Lysobacterales bacterium CG17_big_fil_post_rev_8_21_14_2_50_64_11]|nr:MAG: glycosyltransferase [Xanthomonadales bacterium CG17_big_fil_post_rev_8_21_14_2_50_64_11]PIX59842.1 MAG: glycosyltransferase [Xanthomonadales bacterium CG_4_10_14_3_um_filter_64_11]
MKIAYVINSLEGGGAALPVPAVTRVMRNAGAQVKVFALTRRDGRALPAMLADGLDVATREGGEKDHLAAARWLDRELAQYQPSHVWTSLSRASVIGLVHGWRHHLPVVVWQHNAYLNATGRRLLHLLRKRPALWVSDSERVDRLTAERFQVPAQQRVIWPLFAADPHAPQATPWREGETLRLGSLGRLNTIKGYDVLLAALARLQAGGFAPPTPFSITIAGDGEEHSALAAAARAIGFDALHLPGFTEQPRAFLAGLHLYLQPSRAEGLCIAMHEAMQAGLPVIASAVGQMADTLEPGHSGWLVPAGDADALADALRTALSQPQQLAAIGATARARVLARFSESAFREAGEAALARLRALTRQSPR